MHVMLVSQLIIDDSKNFYQEYRDSKDGKPYEEPFHLRGDRGLLSFHQCLPPDLYSLVVMP